MKVAFTSSSEGQVVRSHVWRKEVLSIVLPHVGNMSSVTRERSACFLVTVMKKARPILLRVGLKVKEEVDLVRSGLWPFFEFIKDIERGQHPRSVRGNLKRGHPEVISHPLEK